MEGICKHCEGRGDHVYYIPPPKQIPGNPEQVSVTCSACRGTGYKQEGG